jgi:hypothetical protein
VGPGQRGRAARRQPSRLEKTVSAATAKITKAKSQTPKQLSTCRSEIGSIGVWRLDFGIFSPDACCL